MDLSGVYSRVTRTFGPLMGAHRWLYENSGGRIGRRIPGVGAPMLLLYHVGAKSGVERNTPLLYIDADDEVAIIASKGGNPRHPAWLHNLRANPETTVMIGTELRRVRAREAVGAERDRLYERASEAWPAYRDYQARTERKIPVVVLERVG